MRWGPYRYDLIFESADDDERTEQVTVIADDGHGYLRIRCRCEGGFALGPCPHLQAFAQKFPAEVTQEPWQRLVKLYWSSDDLTIGDCGRKIEY